MPDTIEIPPQGFPVSAWIPAWPAGTDLKAALPELRARREQTLPALAAWQERVDALYDDAVRGNRDGGQLIQWAEAVHDRERAESARLHAAIEPLEDRMAAYGSGLDPELRQFFEEGIALAWSWLAPYRTLRARLIWLAHRRSGIEPGPLLARPVEGEIDHAKLSREFMARFPKIRAALAE